MDKHEDCIHEQYLDIDKVNDFMSFVVGLGIDADITKNGDIIYPSTKTLLKQL